MSMKRCFGGILFTFLLSTTLFAYEKLEPADGTKWWAIGQHQTGIYWTMISGALDPLKADTGKAPKVYSDYMGIGGNITTWLTNFENNKAANGDPNVVPILAMSFHSVDKVEQLFNGGYNTTLRGYGQALKEYAKPVFIRPLYEINVGDHASYLRRYAEQINKPYYWVAREAFRKVWKEIQIGAGSTGNAGDDRLPLVAFVQHFVIFPDDDPALQGYSHEDYYAGDDYVDWIGLSCFQAGPLRWGWQDTFLDMAELHDKPIAIVESSAEAYKYSDGIHIPNIVSQYFEPYFQFITDNDHVKLFVYINLDYTQITYDDDQGWGPWPDLRLQSEPDAYDYFRDQLNSLTYTSWQNEGHTAAYVYRGNVVVIRKDRWYAHNSVTFEPIGAGQIQDVWNVPGTIKPWDGAGVTAAYAIGDTLYVISKDKRWTFNGKTWSESQNLSSAWSGAKPVDGKYPWTEGVTATYQVGDITMAISRDKYWLYNKTTRKWYAEGFLAEVWSGAPYLDGERPWSGEGVTACYMNGNFLQIFRGHRYWNYAGRWLGAGYMDDIPANNPWWRQTRLP